MRAFVVFAICMAAVSAAPWSSFASGSSGASAQAGARGLAGVLPGAVSLAGAGARGVQSPVTVEFVPAAFSLESSNGGASGINGALANPGVTAGTNTGFVNTGSYSNSAATSVAAGARNSGSFVKTDVKIEYATPVIEKNFYYHIAEEDASANAAANTLTITPRKHYKVIFIKAPTASANAAARARAASRTEEKTIVYVLVNKPVEADAAANATSSTFNSGKPEVYFIKYGSGATASARSASNADAGVGVGFGGYGSGIARADARAGANAGEFGGAAANAGASVGIGNAGSIATANTDAGASAFGAALVEAGAQAGANAVEFGGAEAGAVASAGATFGLPDELSGDFNNAGATANAGARASTDNSFAL